MLEYISAIHFQIHDSVTAVFDPFTTTFIGPTDSGKSSLLRCLKWICLNVPQGDEFIKDGEEHAEGILTLDGGREVKRIRGKQNTYEFDGKQYKSFGASVPQDVADLLNVSPLQFQDQITLPFWFCLPPSQVARELNQIVNLDIIDAVLSHVTTEVRKRRAEVEFTEERLKKAREERDALAWVKNCNRDLRALEEAIKDHEDTVRHIMDLEKALGEIESFDDRVRVNKEGTGQLRALLSAYEDYSSLSDRIENLETVVAQVGRLEKQWRDTVMSREELEKEMAELLKDGCPLCGQTLPRTSLP